MKFIKPKHWGSHYYMDEKGIPFLLTETNCFVECAPIKPEADFVPRIYTDVEILCE
jgi:hypothetical protein